MVLKQDVEKLGFRGQEVSVKAGYARNYLYPEKMAVYATPDNVAKFKVNKESVDEGDVEKERTLKQIISRLSSVEVEFKRHTAAKGEQTLHSSVTYVCSLCFAVTARMTHYCAHRVHAARKTFPTC